MSYLSLILSTKLKFPSWSKELWTVPDSLTFKYIVALTKKLLEQARKEWDENLKKREEELSEEKKETISLMAEAIKEQKKKGQSNTDFIMSDEGNSKN